MSKKFLHNAVRYVLLSSVLLCAGACVSSSGPSPAREPVKGTPLGLVMPTYPFEETPTGVDIISLQARFLSAPWGLLESFGFVEGARSLGAEELEKLERSIANGDVLVTGSSLRRRRPGTAESRVGGSPGRLHR